MTLVLPKAMELTFSSNQLSLMQKRLQAVGMQTTTTNKVDNGKPHGTCATANVPWLALINGECKRFARYASVAFAHSEKENQRPQSEAMKPAISKKSVQLHLDLGQVSRLHPLASNS